MATRGVRVIAGMFTSLVLVAPVANAAPLGGDRDGGLERGRERGRTAQASMSGPSGADTVADGWVVQFVDDVDATSAEAVLAEHGVTAERLVDSSGLPVIAHVDADAAQADALRDDVSVSMVEANVRIDAPEPLLPGATRPEAIESGAARTEVVLAATQLSAPWGLDRSDQRDLPLSGGYDMAATGAGVTVYVVDSGVRGDHVEFAGRVQPGFSVFGSDGWDDCVGHGTHVAGTIASRSYGMAKEATIVPVQVGNCSFLFAFDIVAGLRWVIDHHQPGRPAVANLSLGTAGNPVIDAAVRDVIADGVTVVAAAGNYGEPACWMSPAREPQVITVAAVDRTDWSPNWSNWGSCVDIFAPGEDVESTLPHRRDAVGSNSGTSMSAPHVAGAVALMLQFEPELTPAQVTARLLAQATPGRVGNAGAGSPNRLLFVPSGGGLPVGSAAPPGDFVALSPGRLMDTRPGAATIDGAFAGGGRRQGGRVTELLVAGRAGVAADASAVVLNVTMVDAAADGFLTVFPCGSVQPLSSNLNVWAGGTIANAVVAKVGAGGAVCLLSNIATDLVVDVNGFHPAGSGYRPVWPARLLDSRPEGVTVDGGGARIGARPSGWTTELLVAGRGGVPSDVAAVVLNVTVTGASAAGFVTVFPCGSARPLSSSLNFWPGATVPNAVVAKVGAGGKVCLFSSVGLHLVVDVNGFHPAGSSYQASTPGRLVDTRADGSTIDDVGARIGRRGAGQETVVPVTGRAGVPWNATAVVLNVTVTNPLAAGFVTVFPCGEARPASSNINVWAGATVANAVVAKVGAGGSVCVFTSMSTDVVVDVNGSYAG